MDATLGQFIDQIMKEAELPDSLDAEVKDQVKKDLTERAMDVINYALVDAMTPEVQKEFEKLAEQENLEAQTVTDFVKKHVPDSEQVAARALLEFRAAYLGLA